MTRELDMRCLKIAGYDASGTRYKTVHVPGCTCHPKRESSPDSPDTMASGGRHGVFAPPGRIRER